MEEPNFNQQQDELDENPVFLNLGQLSLLSK